MDSAAVVRELEALARRTREAPTQLERQLAASCLAATVERHLETLREMARRGSNENGRSTAHAQPSATPLGADGRAPLTHPQTQETT